MNKKKKYGFDPFEAVVRHGKLTAGVVGVTGVTGSLATQLPSATGSRVVAGMDTLKVVPMVHGAGVAMGSLGMLGDVERKIKKKR